jgi:concanavalin A-like lectin/glucanase superfamily protein
MAYSGNASNQRLDGADVAQGLSNLTVSFWYKALSNPGTSRYSQPLGIREGVPTAGCAVNFTWDHLASQYMQSWLYADGGFYPTATYTTALVGGTWYCLTYTFDGTNGKAWLNGVVEATSPAIQTAVWAPATSHLSLLFGDAYDDGTVAEAALWNVVLTAGEIAAIQKGFSPALIRPQSLVDYWPLTRDLSVVKGGAISAVNSPVVENHPRVYYPTHSRQRLIPAVAAAAGGPHQLVNAGLVDRGLVNAGLVS